MTKCVQNLTNVIFFYIIVLLLFFVNKKHENKNHHRNCDQSSFSISFHGQRRRHHDANVSCRSCCNGRCKRMSTCNRHIFKISVCYSNTQRQERCCQIVFFFIFSKTKSWKTIHKQSKDCIQNRKRFETRIFAKQMSVVQHNFVAHGQTRLKNFFSLKNNSVLNFYFFKNKRWQILSHQERFQASFETKCLTMSNKDHYLL